MNIDLFDTASSNYRHFQYLLECFNLIQIINNPTKIEQTSITLLDCQIPELRLAQLLYELLHSSTTMSLVVTQWKLTGYMSRNYQILEFLDTYRNFLR